ncbi:MAG TPA: type I polyketide synthase [Candidatus Deferrimicrobium sp.]|nr:type I polyketide synthase [Candidatus Deferrimicrobium sp.]
MSGRIAVVGMACIYPDARSPQELWENVLAQRQAFRRIPPQRLSTEDYLSSDRGATDLTYSMKAALIEGYEFDRERFRVVGSTYRSTDLTHWLALDVASQALADAGFPDGEGLPKESTGVLVGNTLTGEFSRAALMRLRWPYVRRIVNARLVAEGWDESRRAAFLSELETHYKAPFPEVGDETLAGGLSNTIAGRICNHFDLGGGGYTIDGACSSSLLAAANACSALVAGDVDVALAGGVDISLDPFELVGFSRVGALAESEMRIYDACSTGFLPGEGCGFVVLMRHEDALKQGHRVYAAIDGWGISSDGSGGLTRPEITGQRTALTRAYRRAGCCVETVGYFEGHGTGTDVGDLVELRALAGAIGEHNRSDRPAAVGSVKANIGHTKAAAGVAGLIKAVTAVYKQIIPPHTGFEKPHPELSGKHAPLQVLREGHLFELGLPIRAGVSSMGFGGINTHITLSGASERRRQTMSAREKMLMASPQDTELLLLSADTVEGLRQQILSLHEIAPRLSRAEVGDLAAHLAAIQRTRQWRAAVVVSTPDELTNRLHTLSAWLESDSPSKIDSVQGVFLGHGSTSPRIGFLFPGQASPAYVDGGALRRRFENVKELYSDACLPCAADSIETSVAQPAIVTASLAALRVLNILDITAEQVAGHSLGELTAYHWAGVVDETTLITLAAVRGRLMTEFAGGDGAMASIGAEAAAVQALLNDDPRVVIAGLNAPNQTVVSGERTAVSSLVARAQQAGFRATLLPVSHAFHSSLMEPVIEPFAQYLASIEFRRPHNGVISTITGLPLDANIDLKELLCRQLTSPVRFFEAVRNASSNVDLWLEVGPGQVLGGVVSELVQSPVISVDAGGPKLRGLLSAVGAAYALGAEVNHRALFADRFTRPFALDYKPRFFVNPCELAPSDPLPVAQTIAPATAGQHSLAAKDVAAPPARPESMPIARRVGDASTGPADALSIVKQLVSDKTELPISAITTSSRFLDDLHLNSIAVSQIAAEAARRLNLPPLVSPNQFADATVAQMAEALVDLKKTAATSTGRSPHAIVAGIGSWVRTFTVELSEKPLTRKSAAVAAGSWQLFAPRDYPLSELLKKRFDAVGGGGYAVCLPPHPTEEHVHLLLQAAHAVLNDNRPTRIVFVQHGGGAASLARTLHLEARGLTTCVVDVPFGPEAIDWIVAEAVAAVGYCEAHYDANGARREPTLKLLPSRQIQHESVPLGPDDVLFVTGGGKGIAAECAAELAQATGVRLALVGRSRPESDGELAANLARLGDKGIGFRYFVADVTDPAQIKAAVADAQTALGPVTGFLHGAGINVPRLLRTLDESTFRATIATKVQGARNVLAALDTELLKLLVTFGSIIARTGLQGEADYAVANEWLTRLTEEFQRDHPDCRCLAIEWSVWSGVGMGERLGRIETLSQQGITPISTDEGISLFRRLLNQKLPPSVVVAGRMSDLPTLKIDKPELPLWRFLESPRVFYPGVELIVDVKLSEQTDPYLADHIFRGEQLFPAVMGLEAMAQVAMAATGSSVVPVFEQVHFERPVVVPKGGATTIRLAALVRDDGVVEIALRSEETDFHVDHFRAHCRPAESDKRGSETTISPATPVGGIPLVPQRDLYGNLLFHEGRFRRLKSYSKLRARSCEAEIVPDGTAEWFSRYLPQQLVLGDPALRDAAIHAIQACVPQASLLPTACERVTPMSAQLTTSAFVRAVERHRQGDVFTYDVDVIDADGRLCERWEGLKLQIVSGTTRSGDWIPSLLGPYVERRIHDIVPDAEVSVVIESVSAETRREASDRVIERAVGQPLAVHRRPDGKPEAPAGRCVSASHAGDITMAVAAATPVACDIEAIVERPDSTWIDLLGTAAHTLAASVARESGEVFHTSATRIWAVRECLKKAGAGVGSPIVVSSAEEDGWIRFSSGGFILTTYCSTVRGGNGPLVLAFLVTGSHESV